MSSCETQDSCIFDQNIEGKKAKIQYKIAHPMGTANFIIIIILFFYANLKLK